MDEKVTFLSDPENYPVQAASVRRVQSHMSWVFLVDGLAYKLKKPVRYEFLDFSTLDRRRRDCELEIQLNRRLAAHVYLGTVPLTVDPTGRLQLDGGDRVADWLVKMRRLPAERTLEATIECGAAREGEVRKAAELLARFYRDSSPVPVSRAERLGQLAESVDLTRRELTRPGVTLPQSEVLRTADALEATLRTDRGSLEARVGEGRIIDAHGDLRPEHVYLGEPPAVIDCLEFNQKFRWIDMASDLAFLTLECDRIGGGGVGDWIWDTYRAVTGDAVEPELVTFYARLHAFTRARLAVWHLNEPGDAGPDKWIAKAGQYLELAATYRR